MAHIRNLERASALADYITSEQLAAKLQLDRATLFRMRARGVLPYVKLGRTVLFDPAAVAASLEKLTVNGRN